MIIDTTKHVISLYSVFLLSSIFAGMALAIFILLRYKVNKTVAVFSSMINIMLILFLGLMMTMIVGLINKEDVIGFSSMGGMFGLLLGTFISYKAFKCDMLLKAYTLVLPLMYAISKFGCFSAGCCGGREYHGILAVRYMTKEGFINEYPTFPVPLLETVVFAVIFSAMLISFDKFDTYTHMIINIMLCAIAKGSLDFLRASHINKILTINQFLCLIMIFIDIIFITRKHYSKITGKG